MHPRRSIMVAYYRLRQLQVKSAHAGGSRVSLSQWLVRSDDLRSRQQTRCHRRGLERMKERPARLQIPRPYAPPGQQAPQPRFRRRPTARRQYIIPPLACLPPLHLNADPGACHTHMLPGIARSHQYLSLSARLAVQSYWCSISTKPLSILRAAWASRLATVQ